MPAFDRLPWLLASIVSALLAMASNEGLLGEVRLYFVFKPLTTILIIAMAWPRGCGTPAQRRAVLIGLVLSLVGDVALLWRQGFVPGLVSFLLAHLAYLAAFARVQPLAARRGPFVVYAIVAALVFSLLWPDVPKVLRLPVALYVAALASMAAQAAVLWRSALHDAAARRLALGGLLFLASDTLLAVNRFSMPLPLAGVWVLSTYWLAQACIASWLASARSAGSSTAEHGR
ncbi:MAG: lysoplasmalogenase [Burkholderiales bacterium]|nr:lysoplasmalogenase [Burkholderiales bacterium]